MKSSTQQYVVLPRIKRVKNSWERKVIQYLIAHPSGKFSPELEMEAIVAYWLVEALENNVDRQQLIIASRNAIEKLEAKLAIIRKIVGLHTHFENTYTYIENEPNIHVELPKIKKNQNSWSGKVIQYLLEHPSGEPSTELAINAIVYYWVVEALENHVERSELIKASRMAQEMLEARLVTIKQIIGLETALETARLPVSQNEYVTTTVEEPLLELQPSDKDDGDDGDDDEDWSDLLDEQTLLLANIFSS